MTGMPLILLLGKRVRTKCGNAVDAIRIFSTTSLQHFNAFALLSSYSRVMLLCTSKIKSLMVIVEWMLLVLFCSVLPAIRYTVPWL